MANAGLGGRGGRWLRIICNRQDETRLGDRTLICTGQDVCTKRGGCRRSSSPRWWQRSWPVAPAREAGTLHKLESSRRREARDLRSRRPTARDLRGRLRETGSGILRSGVADAPVVLTEYSDYQ